MHLCGLLRSCVIERYKYRAINFKGQPVRGLLAAANEVDLYNQLQTSGLELVSCSPVKEGGGLLGGLFKKKIGLRDLITLFITMEQMQKSGVPMLDALGDIRDTMDNPSLRDIMTEVYRQVSEGSSLSESLSNYPKVFNNLHISLIKSGEETGDLTVSYRNLVVYMKWVDEMQRKIRKATRYPMVVGVVVMIVIAVMMILVVPQIVGFLSSMDMELPWYTTALIATSEFFQEYWYVIFTTPVAIFYGIKILYRKSRAFAFKFDTYLLSAPVIGPLVRKINIARYTQTFSSLFSSGVDVLRCLDSSQQTMTNLALYEAMETVQRLVREGSTLSQSFNQSGEFPSMVVRMLKIGEESGNVSHVLDQVSEFYTKDVDEEVQKLITMIEPALTVVMGSIILWIAAGVFGPIYSNLGKITQ